MDWDDDNAGSGFGFAQTHSSDSDDFESSWDDPGLELLGFGGAEPEPEPEPEVQLQPPRSPAELLRASGVSDQASGLSGHSFASPPASPPPVTTSSHDAEPPGSLDSSGLLRVRREFSSDYHQVIRRSPVGSYTAPVRQFSKELADGGARNSQLLSQLKRDRERRAAARRRGGGSPSMYR